MPGLDKCVKITLFASTLMLLLPCGCNLAGRAGMFGFGEKRQADPPTPEPEPYVKIISGREVHDLAEANAIAGPTTTSAPAQKINPLDDTKLNEVSFNNVPLSNVALMLTKMIGQNVVSSSDAGGKLVTIYLKDVTARSAIEAICRVNGLWYREDPQVIRLLTRDEYGRELVIRTDEQTRLYYLKNASASGVADMIASLMPDQVQYITSGDETSFGHVGTDGDDPMTNTRTGTGGNSSRTSGTVNGTNGNTNESVGGVSRSNFGYTPSDVATNYQKGLAAGKIEELTKNASTRQSGEVTAQSVAEKTGIKPTVTISVFMRNNCIAVRTVQESIHGEIGKIIEALDTPTRQVMLEVKVLKINLGDGFQSVFGMNYTTGSTLPKLDIKWLDGADINGSTLSFNYLNNHVTATLKLLKDDNRLHTVATPMLLCANNAPAEFFSGVTRMITTNYDYETRTNADGVVQDIARPIVEERDIGTTVKIRPSINTDGTVTMRFFLDIGSVNSNGANIYQVNSKGQVVALPIDTVNNEKAQSIVVAKHSQAVVMGGLITESVSKARQRFPLIGDTPIIGTFFGKQVDSTTRTETIMIIVPHIIGIASMGQEVSRPILENNTLHPMGLNNSKSMTRWDPYTDRIHDNDYPPLVPPRQAGDKPAGKAVSAQPPAANNAAKGADRK